MEKKTANGKTKITGTVVATTKSLRNYMGKIQLGVRLEINGVEDWCNIEGTTEALEAVQKSGILAKGNVISGDLDAENVLSGISLVSEAPKFSGAGGDDEVNLDTLLEAAHRRGLAGITTELIDSELKTPGKNYATFRATVSMDTKRINGVTGEPILAHFVGHGEVLEENIKAKPGDHFDMVPHLFRFAETRAICRALRWATNNAQAAQEEKATGEGKTA